MAEASEADLKSSEAETVRTGGKEGSPVSVGGQQLESVPETSGNAEDQKSLECDNTANNVKDKRKERLDRLRELHLRRVSQ